MDIISDKSRDLFGALAFLSGDEKEEFFRWALKNKNQNNISHHMLFGHPYYHLTLVHGALETTVPMEFINKTHRDIIIEYTTKGPFASRVLINELLFFALQIPKITRRRLSSRSLWPACQHFVRRAPMPTN